MVSLADEAITLVPGQLAEWSDAGWNATTMIATSDPTVFEILPDAEHSPFTIRALRPGQATARVYTDVGRPRQLLTVTVTAE